MLGEYIHIYCGGWLSIGYLIGGGYYFTCCLSLPILSSHCFGFFDIFVAGLSILLCIHYYL